MRIGAFSVLLEDANQRLEIEAALARERDNFRKAPAQVKTLSGLPPICSYCKQIGNDQGCREKIENHISQHSQVIFSHGICPE